MRFFDEETNGKPMKETLVLMEFSDQKEMFDAMEYYVKNNPRKIKAKKLLKEMTNKWCSPI